MRVEDNATGNHSGGISYGILVGKREESRWWAQERDTESGQSKDTVVGRLSASCDKSRPMMDRKAELE